jgi:hypothetical protein
MIESDSALADVGLSGSSDIVAIGAGEDAREGMAWLTRLSPGCDGSDRDTWRCPIVFADDWRKAIRWVREQAAITITNSFA